MKERQSLGTQKFILENPHGGENPTELFHYRFINQVQCQDNPLYMRDTQEDTQDFPLSFTMFIMTYAIPRIYLCYTRVDLHYTKDRL